jgi:hypothetical protein
MSESTDALAKMADDKLRLDWLEARLKRESIALEYRDGHWIDGEGAGYLLVTERKTGSDPQRSLREAIDNFMKG